MTSPDTAADTFGDFVRAVEPRLRRGLVSSMGVEVGSEATAEALAYGWQHWDRVREMANPAGYLYRVGRSRVPRRRGERVLLPEVDLHQTPWVEPALPAALAALSESQRLCVVMVHCYGYSLAEVAELLAVSKSTVQRHTDRALRRLRRALGVAT